MIKVNIAVFDGEFNNSSISEEEPDEDIRNTYTEFDEFGQNGYDDTNGQCSTAISKLQIRLNDVINRHKAPLLLYDEIVHLINDYISSENFSKYGKLKTRQSFLRQMEITHPSVTALRPVNKQVTLHDGNQVSLPVFDARSMIMDLLTNPELMRKENIAEGYNVFTGDIDNNHPSNLNYGEIHTGDEWIPARDRYCQSEDDMPVGIVIFGDKSHTDLHGALALTPIIFTCHSSTRSVATIQNSGGCLDICLILVMGKTSQTKHPRLMRYKMSTTVCHVYSSQSDRYTRTMVSKPGF